MCILSTEYQVHLDKLQQNKNLVTGPHVYV